MATPPKMRELARRLLAYEAASSKTSEPVESASLRVYDKLRQSLSAFAGVAAFESLAFRALTQAKSDAPDLWALQIAEDGSLEGLGKFGPQLDTDEDQAGENPADGGGIALITRLLGLLLIFLGEALTMSLLRHAWPDATLEHHSSENWREL